MKRFLSIFLILSCFLLLVSCGRTLIDDETTCESKSIHPEETTGGRDGIWLGLPSTFKQCNPDELDVELMISSDSFSVDAEMITINIVNKTGKPFYFSPMFCVEKKGCGQIYPYEGEFWIRQPYNYISPFVSAASGDNAQVSVSIERKYWADGYMPTPGKYRVVVVVENQPYTIEFELH